MSEFKAPALAKGLDILDLIQENGPLSFNEIQNYTHDNPASLSRYLHTLLAKNYLHKDINNKYEFGLKLMSLTNPKSLWPKLIVLCKPYMIDINKTFDITVLLLVYTAKEYMALEKVLAPDNLGMMPKNDMNFNEITSIWSNKYYTKNFALSIKSPRDNIEELPQHFSEVAESVVSKGYMSYRMKEKQILRMGFPIYYNNQVIATIGIGSFFNQLNETQIKDLTTRIISCITKIQKEL